MITFTTRTFAPLTAAFLASPTYDPAPSRVRERLSGHISLFTITAYLVIRLAVTRCPLVSQIASQPLALWTDDNSGTVVVVLGIWWGERRAIAVPGQGAVRLETIVREVSDFHVRYSQLLSRCAGCKVMQKRRSYKAATLATNYHHARRSRVAITKPARWLMPTSAGTRDSRLLPPR